MRCQVSDFRCQASRIKPQWMILLLLPALTVSAQAQTQAETKVIADPFAQPPVHAPAAAAVRPEPARIEGAVAGGLRWLAEHQLQQGAEAGAWSVNVGNYRPAVASLAGLAFLANGYLPGTNAPYNKTVASALKYVTGTMASDGYIGQGDRSGMYIHAISSLFALSCLGMQTEEKVEPDLAEWCRRSLNVIVKSQQMSKSAIERGGWRYDPYTSESDVSITCWQLLVLHTARQAGFEVEPSVFSSALAYLNRAYVPVKSEQGQEKSGLVGGYLYRPGYTYEPSRSSTALVLFIQSLFDAVDEQRKRQVLRYLSRYPLTWDGNQYGGYFFFSGFYMVQGMFQVGGDDWNSFGPRMATLLLDHQSGDGTWPYPPGNVAQEQMQSTGPAYPVAMAVLMLSLDKQYLPMYQRQSRIYERNTPAVQAAERPADADTDPGVKEPKKRPVQVEPEMPPVAPPAPVGGPTTQVTVPEAGGDEEPGEDAAPSPIGRPVFK